jgi:hypothetical protein
MVAFGYIPPPRILEGEKMAEKSYTVAGMTCDHCARSVHAVAVAGCEVAA